MENKDLQDDTKIEFQLVGCPVTQSIKTIGGKWKPIILHMINNDINRFGKLQKNMAAISKQMLTNQLRELERDGIIERKVFPVIPPRVEYYLTDRGRLVIPVLKELAILGEKLQKL